MLFAISTDSKVTITPSICCLQFSKVILLSICQKKSQTSTIFLTLKILSRNVCILFAENTLASKNFQPELMNEKWNEKLRFCCERSYRSWLFFSNYRYLQADLETFDLRDLKSVFDVILIDPPLEEYQRRCPGRTFSWRPWEWDEVA